MDVSDEELDRVERLIKDIPKEEADLIRFMILRFKAEVLSKNEPSEAVKHLIYLLNGTAKSLSLLAMMIGKGDRAKVMGMVEEFTHNYRMMTEQALDIGDVLSDDPPAEERKLH